MKRFTGRLRKNFQAGLKRIFGFDQFQMRLAAIEQLCEELLEVAVHNIKGIRQALSRFLVQLVNSAAQFFDRLDQIIATVRSKDTSLERSLDLFDEAIELGSRAVDMVDKFELTPREADKLEQEYDEDAANESQDRQAASTDTNG